jgi:hypothetical protein
MIDKKHNVPSLNKSKRHRKRSHCIWCYDPACQPRARHSTVKGNEAKQHRLWLFHSLLSNFLKEEVSFVQKDLEMFLAIRREAANGEAADYLRLSPMVSQCCHYFMFLSLQGYKPYQERKVLWSLEASVICGKFLYIL